jgi:DUF971 family protein
MNPPPSDIKARREPRRLELTWPDGTVQALPFKFLRCACTCAGCVHEFTGERLLDPATVPEDISIASLELVGNYALKITWTDGHDTGLYTWERLAALDPSAA